MSAARPRRPRPRLRRLAGVATAVAVLAGALTAAVATEDSAEAVSASQILKDFDPADIISDGVMFNPSTMSPAAIQTFLDGKVPTCRPGYTCLKDHRQDTTTKAADPMCSTYTGRKDESAATIIHRVAQACGVNPQVLIVTLQKEQSLITDDWPSARQFRSATGYGCPDTAPCDTDFYGFFNQVYKAAWAFKRYTTPPGTTGPGWTSFNWFPIGRPTGVLYNPNSACGASTVTIKNKATAVLYYFTPYQPNAAALAAGQGIGNSCSAYGNRNFFYYFTAWFGSTHYAVGGAIGTLWRSLGGANSALGEPIAGPTTVEENGGGTSQRFENGLVLSSASGTHVVTGAVAQEYLATGGPKGELGWPRKGVKKRSENGGGVIQPFQNGSIYSSAAGSFAVTGSLYAKYGRTEFQAGALGWPTGDAVTSTAAGGGVQQSFAGGRIAKPGTGPARLLTGTVLEKYIARGAEAGSLGWPTTEAATVRAKDRTGRVQTFSTGAVYVLDRTYTVTRDLYRNYRHHGGPTGTFGWPRSAAAKSTANGGGWAQRFESGSIYFNATARAHPLRGDVLALYNRRGGTAGTLGWPGTKKRDAAGVGGSVTPFTNGTIYSSKAGTVAVLGDILARYTAKGGPGGVLGWPTGAARHVDGRTVQTFERGSISWTAAGGAKASRS